MCLDASYCSRGRRSIQGHNKLRPDLRNPYIGQSVGPGGCVRLDVLGELLIRRDFDCIDTPTRRDTPRRSGLRARSCRHGSAHAGPLGGSKPDACFVVELLIAGSDGAGLAAIGVKDYQLGPPSAKGECRTRTALPPCSVPARSSERNPAQNRLSRASTS